MVRRSSARRAFRRAPVRSIPACRASRSEAGYNLVILVVAITLLHIALAVAMPLWSTAMQREREEEAIFRGMQYAEAIRVFRERFGRYPVELKELIELEPRSIRQLWTDPLSEEGKTSYGLLVEARSRPVRGRQRGRDGRRDGVRVEQGGRRDGRLNKVPLDKSVRPNRTGGRLPTLAKIPPRPPEAGRRRFRARAANTGPIRGVYIANEGTAIKKFQDTTSYQDWAFTDQLIPVPDLLIGALPVVNSDWIGRPFAIDVSAVPARKGQELGGKAAPGRLDSLNGGAANRTKARGSQSRRSSSRDRRSGRRRPR